MKPKAASTASSGIAKRPQKFCEETGGFGAGAADDAAAADEDAADAVEFADGGGLVCSC